MLVTILSFIAVLLVLVLIHEFGHFIVAKLLGVKVEEFSFGFPPRVFGKKIGETIYSLNLLPIGGFVKLYGEDEAGGGKLTTNHEPKTKNLDRAFFARPVWQRAVIVFAGVVMNFLLAVVLLSFLVGIQGVPVHTDKVVVGAIVPGSPADKGGLKVGDAILTIDGKRVTTTDQLISYTKRHEGQPISLTVESSNSTHHTITLTPRKTYPSNEGPMGVAIGNLTVKKYPWYEVPFIGLREALVQSWLIIQGIGQVLVQLIFNHQVPADVAGPVGIAQITGQYVQLGFSAVMFLVAALSLNLAILNVLPIPALDGGRLFFILWEGVTGRKVSPRVEGYIHAAGMAFLFALIALVTYHDISRLASGQSLLPK